MNKKILIDLENNLIQNDFRLQEIKKEKSLIFEFKNCLIDNDIKSDILVSALNVYQKYLNIKYECLEHEQKVTEQFYQDFKGQL